MVEHIIGLIPYLLAIWPGVWIVKGILWLAPPRGSFSEQDKVGTWIGVFERWIAVYLILNGKPEALVFIIAAKGLLRLSNTRRTTKGDGEFLFSSYVLLGTLVSIVVAVCIAEVWPLLYPSL